MAILLSGRNVRVGSDHDRWRGESGSAALMSDPADSLHRQLSRKAGEGRKWIDPGSRAHGCRSAQPLAVAARGSGGRGAARRWDSAVAALTACGCGRLQRNQRPMIGISSAAHAPNSHRVCCASRFSSSAMIRSSELLMRAVNSAATRSIFAFRALIRASSSLIRRSTEAFDSLRRRSTPAAMK